jgi:hypothetical protein
MTATLPSSEGRAEVGAAGVCARAVQMQAAQRMTADVISLMVFINSFGGKWAGNLPR